MSCDDAGDFLREDLLPGCERFYFDIYQPLSADRLQDLGQRGDPLACKSRIESTSGIEFPQGSNHKGQLYGPITCMPLPEQEKRANPNIPA